MLESMFYRAASIVLGVSPMASHKEEIEAYLSRFSCLDAQTQQEHYLFALRWTIRRLLIRAQLKQPRRWKVIQKRFQHQQ
jgi:hypothetical protein